ncbi:MAG: 16S rRNA (guanine(527)-N(7))-methyltransferase RsmG [Burkholderiales bacterium]|nr:16S rRNA (guanine(527)-N(7))-methyltransferase RsmG [Burkholderiales bacterium]
MREWGLAEHGAVLGLQLSSCALGQFDALLRLLAKWNRVYNLTSLQDEVEWVSHHFLDSLSILKLLPSGLLLDVGSGGGFPGVPIAIANPEREVVLLDSNLKKTAFLRQVVAELSLRNVTVATTRVEDFDPDRVFDVVVSRAFSDLQTFLRLGARLCRQDGTLLAMKGAYPADELACLPHASIEKVVKLEVPLLGKQRHAVFLRPVTPMEG